MDLHIKQQQILQTHTHTSKHEYAFTKRKLKTSKKLSKPMAPTNPLVRIVVIHYITLTKPSKLSNVDVSRDGTRIPS